jgi:hypothetical protein
LGPVEVSFSSNRVDTLAIITVYARLPSVGASYFCGVFFFLQIKGFIDYATGLQLHCPVYNILILLMHCAVHIILILLMHCPVYIILILLMHCAVYTILILLMHRAV